MIIIDTVDVFSVVLVKVLHLVVYIQWSVDILREREGQLEKKEKKITLKNVYGRFFTVQVAPMAQFTTESSPPYIILD